MSKDINKVCPKCGSPAEAEGAWSCGSWEQHGFFRSEECRDNEISRQSTEIARLKVLLTELTAMVRGECPSLLNEDSGGSARLSMEIDEALELLSPVPTDTRPV